MFKQITLPYAYDALEPVIDALTVETHYAKHHAAYTKNFNDFAQKAGVADKTIEEIATECRFYTPNYFMGCFFHEYKMTPREYREESKG